MIWTVSLTVLMLLTEVRVSTQDMVTLAPDEVKVQEATSIPAEDSTVKPTIQSLHITSDIKYRYAVTLISSRVVNPSNNSGKANFTVTLPETALISEFLVEMKGKVYKADVKDKEETKAAYNQSLQAEESEGHVTLGARDSTKFIVSVDIEANGSVTFNLTYEELLSRKLGVYTNIINIEPQQIVEDMSVTVNIEEPTAIIYLEVPELKTSNEIVPHEKQTPNVLARIEEKSPNHKQVFWAPTLEQQKSLNSTGVSGQFIVKYDVDRTESSTQILADDGYFVHFFAPDKLPKLRQHVVFVLDFCACLSYKEKLQQLKDAMQTILSDLDQEDYFSLVVFHAYVVAWSPKKKYNSGLNYYYYELIAKKQEDEVSSLDSDFIVQATPANIELAKSFLANYQAEVARNNGNALEGGLELINIGTELWKNESLPPQPILVFLTVGKSITGDSNTERIVNMATRLNTRRCPIFSLGFGYDEDFRFLSKLSLFNNGYARYIYEGADASDQLKDFYRTIASPVLSNLTFTYFPGQVEISSVTKVEFPVYFKGSELVLAGRLNNHKIQDKAIIGYMSAVPATGDYVFPIIIDSRSKPFNDTSDYLKKTWSYLTIQQLLDKTDFLDESEKKRKKAIQELHDIATKVDYSATTEKYIPESFLEWLKDEKYKQPVEEKKDIIQELPAVTPKEDCIFPIIIDSISKSQRTPPDHLKFDPVAAGSWHELTIQQFIKRAECRGENVEKDIPKQKALDLALQYLFVTPVTSMVIVNSNGTESSMGTRNISASILREDCQPYLESRKP